MNEGRAMSNGWARSLTEAAALLNRASTWRRVRSDRARKTLSTGSAGAGPSSLVLRTLAPRADESIKASIGWREHSGQYLSIRQCEFVGCDRHKERPPCRGPM